MRHHRIDEVQIVISRISSTRLREIVAMCRELGVGIAFVPGLHDIFAHRISVEHIGNLPLVGCDTKKLHDYTKDWTRLLKTGSIPGYELAVKTTGTLSNTNRYQ